jgi:hypothetical protein
MKKIISFSLFGTNPKYTIGALKNAHLAAEIFPDWICRFYVGRSTYTALPRLIKLLEELSNVELVYMNEEGDYASTFWRFYPCAEEDVSIMMSRDTDSRISYREKSAIDEFINSTFEFHVIRDHPFHLHHEILGGLFACKKGLLKNVMKDIEHYPKTDDYGIDQYFLRDLVYPKVKHVTLTHDEFQGFSLIKKKRVGHSFLGEIFDAEDNFIVEHRLKLKQNLDARSLLFKSKIILKRIIKIVHPSYYN